MLTRSLKTALLVFVPFLNIAAGLAYSGEPQQSKVDAELAKVNVDGVIRSAVGVTHTGTSLPLLMASPDLDLQTKRVRLLLIGGLDGSQRSVDQALSAFAGLANDESLRAKFTASVIPIANPDGWAEGQGTANLSKGNPSRGYPPSGSAYNGPTDPEAAYLWRWIGMHAPDLVIVILSGDETKWTIPPSELPQLEQLAKELKADRSSDPADGLAAQLVKQSPCDVGRVPALTLTVSDSARPEWLTSLAAAVEKSGFSGPSPARKELQKRIARTPIEAATLLSKRYGHELNPVVYIPALALVGRVRLGALTNDGSHLSDVEKIVQPYASGQKQSFNASGGGSALSGHLIFGELAERTGNKRYVELVRQVADLGFDERGQMKESMPFHSEMSDAVFMGTPILAQAAKLTGDKKYNEMALRHMRFMLKLNVRKDGLHRHSPLDETAWGRGNGFPALGLAWTLSEMPEDAPEQAEILAAFQAHLKALVPHQDADGMWHQVIDRPESFREMSGTCMITYAMLRGMRSGWLDEETYRPIVEKSFPAILARIADDGGLVDVCTGTGKMRSLRDYYDRTAILGPDARGGAMSLMVTTEMAAWPAKR